MTDICLASKKGDVLWYAAPGRAILKVVVLEDYQWDDTVLTAIGKLPVSDSTSALFASEASAISWCNFVLVQQLTEAREAVQRAEEALKTVSVIDVTGGATGGPHVTLFDHNDRPELVHPERVMVVTSVEVLEVLGHDTRYTMLDVVLGLTSVLRRWNPTRSVPMRIYVSPRQNFWCAVRPIWKSTEQAPAKLKVTWRFATAEENS